MYCLYEKKSHLYVGSVNTEHDAILYCEKHTDIYYVYKP